MMGIKITQNEGVGVVDKFDERIEIRRVTGRARRRWRDIYVEDCSFAVVEIYGDALQFHHAIIETGAIHGSKGKGVMDKERHSPSPTARARSADDGEILNHRGF